MVELLRWTSCLGRYFLMKKMNAVEMRSLRMICVVSLADQSLHDEIHRITGTSEDTTVRMKNRMAKKNMKEK